MPNAVMKAKSERRRPFIGDQVEECRDVSGLYYILPMQKVFYSLIICAARFNNDAFLAGLSDQLGDTERYLGLCVWKRVLQLKHVIIVRAADTAVLQLPVNPRRPL